jgi:antitoxin component of MazEF toxin-antitoxin module
VTKTISKIGNSQGIIFDAALMDLARVKVGDQVNVTVMPESGAIVLMPLRKASSKKEISSIVKKTAKGYRKTLRKMAGATARRLIKKNSALFER